MDSYTAEEVQGNLNDLIRYTVQERRHCEITCGENRVVILPQDTYQNLTVTLELLSTPGLLENMDLCLTAALEDESAVVDQAVS